MTKTSMSLPELLEKHDEGDFLRAVTEAVLQLLMETSRVSWAPGCAEGRTTWRNGYRDRALETRLGTLNLRVPKSRQRSYLIGRLDARVRRAEGALQVAAFWPEAGVTMPKRRLERLDAGLARLARLAGCERVMHATGWLREPGGGPA